MLKAVERTPDPRTVRRMVNRRWLPLNALRAFEAVAQRMSFTAGAAALHVSQSAVSRHIIALEDLIGHKLFDRRGTRLVLTPAGEALFPEVARALDRMEQAMNAVCASVPTTRPVRLHIPPSLLHQIVLPMLGELRAEFPQLRIDITSAHNTGLPEGDIDMAIVFDRPHMDDRVTDLLWNERVAPICSPETARRAEGRSLEQFLAENQLLLVSLDNEPSGLLWSIYARRMGIHITQQNDISFDTALLAATYAMHAGGVALSDIDMFAGELADGRLVMPYEAVIEPGYGYYLKLLADDLGDPVIGALRLWLIARFGALGAARKAVRITQG